MSTFHWSGVRSGLMGFYVCAAFLYLLFPLLLVVPISFSDTAYIVFPPEGFTFRWYEEFFASRTWMNATGRSLFIAVSAASVSTVIGTMAAVRLTRRFSALARVTEMAFFLPQIVPIIVLALGVFLLFSRVGLYGSYSGIIAVHAMLGLPFVVSIVGGALRSQGQSLELAARICGAGPFQAFRYVTLPIIRPAIIASFIFVFFVSFDELVIVLFVMGGQETLPMRIWADVRHELTPIVAAAATLLIIATATAVVVDRILRRNSV